MTYPNTSITVPPNTPVVGEVHDTPSATERIFVPDAGPFYTDGLVIRNGATILQPLVDWKALWLYPDAVEATGKEVCAVILILNESVSSVTIDYTAVGGAFSSTQASIQAAIDVLVLPDAREISWGMIINVPAQLPPAAHIHHVQDWYGFQDALVVWEGIRVAIANGATESGVIGAIYQYIDNVIANNTASPTDIAALNAAIASAVGAHAVATNAHTKAQVGLDNVDNFLTATTPQAQAGTATDKFMTPAGVFAQIQTKVTKSFLGLDLVPNFSVANQAQAEAGVATDKLMTPQRVQQAIVALSNKTIVGLGNLFNYTVATVGESFAGAVNNKYMTPLRARQAAVGVFGGVRLTDADSITADTCLDPVFTVATTANPASLPAGGAGTVYYVIMNVFRVPAATTDRVVSTPRHQLAFSINRKGLWVRNMPTGSTAPEPWADVLDKGAIGLGNVNNYPMAATGDALIGTAVNSYTSPSTSRAAAQGLMRHVGSLVEDPNNFLMPVAVTAHANCPTNASALDYYKIETVMLANAAGDTIVSGVNRYQIAVGVGSVNGKVWFRYFNGTDWGAGWKETNHAFASQVQAEAGVINTVMMSPQSTRYAINYAAPIGAVALNTVVTQGKYVQAISGYITVANNYPVNYAGGGGDLGTLTVDPIGGRIRQLWMQTNGRTWVRYTLDGGSTWTAWYRQKSGKVIVSDKRTTVGSDAFNLGTLPSQYPDAMLWLRVKAPAGSGAVTCGAGCATGGAGGGYSEMTIPLNFFANNATINRTVSAGGAAVSRSAAGVTNGLPGSNGTLAWFNGASGGVITVSVTGGEGGEAIASATANISRNQGGSGSVFGVATGNPAFVGASSGEYIGGNWQGGGRSINGGAPGGDVYVGPSSQQDQSSGYSSLNGGEGGQGHATNGANATGNAGLEGNGGGAAGIRNWISGLTATSGKGGDGVVEIIITDGGYISQYHYNAFTPIFEF